MSEQKSQSKQSARPKQSGQALPPVPSDTNPQSSVKPLRHRVIILVAIIAAVVAVYATSLFAVTSFSDSNQGHVDASAKVTLPNYYMPGMVLQRNATTTISGTTDADVRLTVTVHNDEDSATCTTVADENGSFAAHLTMPKAGTTPYTLDISSGDHVLLSIDQVYVGDVFVAAGQSNMDLNYIDYYSTKKDAKFNLGTVAEDSDLPDTIDDSLVHFITLEHSDRTAGSDNNDVPLRDVTSEEWAPATGDNPQYLSYIAQLFAEELRGEYSNIPIGIIHTAWDGTAISRHMQGGDIYATHIKPFTGYAIAAVLWYQGESDSFSQQTALSYQYNFSQLVEQYREVFNNADLPFLYVQLARYGSGNDDWMTIREAQLQVALTLDNVAMTVSIDTDMGTSALIHPFGKETIAERMVAQWEAMRKGNTPPSGPLAVSATRYEDDVAKVSFTKATKQGLWAGIPSKKLESNDAFQVEDAQTSSLPGFEVAGDDGVFHTADATIASDDTVYVSSDKVSVVAQVRYLWEAEPEPQNDILLYNGKNLPASPFTLQVTKTEND